MVRPPLPRPTAGGSSAKASSAAVSNAAPATERLTVAEGTVVAGKYRIERALKRGGMGSVWVAKHLTLDTPVAIKFMSTLSAEEGVEQGSSKNPSGSSSSVESLGRFEREAKAAAQIRSANVVQTLDYGVDRGTPYIVMELLQGDDLGARLKRVGRMPLPEITRLVVAVARAVQRAHDAGLVHRDLKPANIFLAKEGDEEIPKVLDFGVAKAVSDRPVNESTIEGTMVGTPWYMSPEQAMAKGKVDHRADLWSLGVIVYRAATGVRPFESESLLELVVQICSRDARPPSQIAPDLPPELDAFMGRALDRDVTRRFQSAKELARALAMIAPPASSVPPPASGTFTNEGGSGLRVPTPDSFNVQALAGAQGAEGATRAAVEHPGPTQDAQAHASLTRRLSVLIALFGLLAVIGIVAMVLALRARARDPDTAAVAASSAPASSLTSTAPPSSIASAAIETPAASSTPSSTSPATASATTSARPAPAQARTVAPPKVDCSMPYYWDSSGTKHIKPQCL